MFSINYCSFTSLFFTSLDRYWSDYFASGWLFFNEILSLFAFEVNSPSVFFWSPLPSLPSTVNILILTLDSNLVLNLLVHKVRLYFLILLSHLRLKISQQLRDTHRHLLPLHLQLLVMFLFKRMLGERDLFIKLFSMKLVALKKFFHFLVPFKQYLYSCGSVNKLQKINVYKLTRNALWTLSKVRCM